MKHVIQEKSRSGPLKCHNKVEEFMERCRTKNYQKYRTAVRHCIIS
jgi:hypothetical protein